MSQNNPDPEELLEAEKDKSRMDSAATADSADSSKPLDEHIADKFDQIDDGDIHDGLSYRDGSMVALFEAMDESGDLSQLVERAAVELENDAPESPARSDACRLLMRVGLQTVDQEALDAAKEGMRVHQQRQTEF